MGGCGSRIDSANGWSASPGKLPESEGELSGAIGTILWKPIRLRFRPNPTQPVRCKLAEETELVMRRLAELPERERLAIHAFFLDECNVQQTAELLGLSRSGVYALLERAVARLASLVAK